MHDKSIVLKKSKMMSRSFRKNVVREGLYQVTKVKTKCGSLFNITTYIFLHSSHAIVTSFAYGVFVAQDDY